MNMYVYVQSEAGRALVKRYQVFFSSVKVRLSHRSKYGWHVLDMGDVQDADLCPGDPSFT